MFSYRKSWAFPPEENKRQKKHHLQFSKSYVWNKWEALEIQTAFTHRSRAYFM